MTKRYIGLLIIVMFGLIRFPLCLNAEDIKTPAELSRYTQYTQHEEITRFLSHVDHLSKEMVVQIIGQTKETRNYGSK
ncbi:MAG: hypothetical protein OEZ52_13045, partial [Candidatus Aminicenantes bacterium]|nr:hypothetical protein [Candidatus Aminicenantes bacterium]